MPRTARKANAEENDPARHALPAVQSRSRATRARILAAAEQEFAEKGYDGARIADIAQRAGCSVGVVYFRFRDKSALFLAIAESFAADARGNLRAVFKEMSGQQTAHIVRLFVTGTANNVRRHRGLFRAIVERGLEHPDAMQTMFRLRDEFAEALNALLETAGQRDMRLKVRVMTQMVYGFLMIGVINPHAPTNIADARALNELADACVAYMGEHRK